MNIRPIALLWTILLGFVIGSHALPAQGPFSADRLRDLVPPGFAIGGVMGGYDTPTFDSPPLEFAKSEFNAVTTKAFMPFGPWSDPNLPIDTSGLVNNVNWARSNGFRVHAHILVYPTENVRLPWFRDLPNDQVEATLQQYVTTMASSTAGDVWVWDVVNEIIGDNGDVMDADGLRIGLGSGDGFIAYKEYEAMGSDYVRKAFEWAKAADPNAILIVNEYSAETINDKSDRLLAFCKKLRDEGVPIDGVGFQNHWLDTRYEPDFPSIRANFQRFADEGFQLFITECDIAATITSDPQADPPNSAELEQQARSFAELLQIALDQPACQSFLMWDFTDETSWLQNTDFTLTLADRRPGFSDTIVPPGSSMFATPLSGGDGIIPITPKPAYFAMQERLAGRTTDFVRLSSGWDRSSSYLARFGFPDETGNYVPGSEIYLETLDDTSRQWSSLIWQIERVESGVFRLRNQWRDGADYLTRQPSSNNPSTAGASIALQGLNEDWLSQQWTLVPQGDGGFRMINRWSSPDGAFTREASGQNASGDYVPGPEVRVYPVADWSSQVWYFERVDQLQPAN
ncbi:endo-1,4-beta-xylanase [Neorhodopirellula pilleata]|uniref:Beta-xylanase n=1 Tax=Neorhodopirellula pilleata TaxID=2714738 RepID=A0A5C5ZXC4_9BACT|nr:endo-1,4-beta-xylanase [Neorhodopirellula pilleata]TWT91617.1 Endo-1,4-beta-xylanase Z precursor [Neorhodopirellula pilleata]